MRFELLGWIELNINLMVSTPKKEQHSYTPFQIGTAFQFEI